MPPRQPLRELKGDALIKALRAQGYGADRIKEGASPLERRAQEFINEERTMETAPVAVPAKKSLLSGKALIIVAAASAIVATVAAFLPMPWQGVALIVAALGALLTGGSLPQFTFAESKPLVSTPLVGTLASFSALLAHVAVAMPDGLISGALGLVAVLCAFLAGKAAPQLTRQ